MIGAYKQVLEHPCPGVMEGAQASEIGSCALARRKGYTKDGIYASLSYLGCRNLIGKNAEWKEL